MFVMVFVMALTMDASAATRPRAVVRTSAPVPQASPATCDAPPPDSCRDGGVAAEPLTAEEVERLARGAARAIDEDGMTIAVVDRSTASRARIPPTTTRPSDSRAPRHSSATTWRRSPRAPSASSAESTFRPA
jgi:hypothetical protein